MRCGRKGVGKGPKTKVETMEILCTLLSAELGDDALRLVFVLLLGEWRHFYLN